MAIRFSVLLFSLIGISAQNTADAAPRINAYSNNISQGAAVTLSGTNFGSTGREVPIKFDDFEAGITGRALSEGGWRVDYGNGPRNPVYSNAHAFGGSTSGHADISMGGDSAAYLSGLNTTTLYISLQFRYSMNGSPTTQKGVRVNANDGPNLYSSQPNVNIQDYATENRATVSMNETSSGKVSYYEAPNISQNTWHRLEYWFKMSEPAGSNNGQVHIWHNLRQNTNRSNINTRASGVADKYQVAMMPFYFGNGGGGKLWYDDVYVSKSRARVEIGNRPVWSDCTKRSIQNVTNWNNSSIDVRINLAGFTVNDDLYMFVVDDTGQVSNGLQLEGLVRPDSPKNLN